MNKYSKIMNPETGRLVSINGKLGKSVLSKYNNHLGGSNCANKPDQECPEGCERIHVTKGKRAGHSYCRKHRSKKNRSSSSSQNERRRLRQDLREDIGRSCSSYNGDEAGCNRRVKCNYTNSGKCRSTTRRYNLERRQKKLGVDKGKTGDRYAYATKLEGDCKQYRGDFDSCVNSGECTYTKNGQCRKKKNTRKIKKQPKLKRQDSWDWPETPRKIKEKQDYVSYY